MKQVLALVATLFAVSAFAADAQPAKHPDPANVAAAQTAKAPAKPEVKKEAAKPAKSEAPAVKEAPKATTTK